MNGKWKRTLRKLAVNLFLNVLGGLLTALLIRWLGLS